MCDKDESNYAALKSRQAQANKETDTDINISMGSTVPIQGEDEDGHTEQ